MDMEGSIYTYDRGICIPCSPGHKIGKVLAAGQNTRKPTAEGS